MQKQIQLFLAFFLVCSFQVIGFAQDLGPNQYKGYILDDKGKKKEGIIEVANDKSPWENQRKVKFISMKTWEKSKGKLKNKDKEKFKPKDITGYGFDGREFFTTKYTAMSGDDATSVNKFTGGMSAVSNLTKNKHFLEKILDGKVTVYRYYGYPPDAAAYSGANEKAQYEEMINNLRTASILLKKGKKGKMKDFEGMLSFKKFIADCPDVLKKYENDEYLYKKGKLKVKNMVQDAKNAFGGVTMEDKALEIMKEYNEKCGK